MGKLAVLKTKVAVLYNAKDPARDTWADWLWDQHVPVVAKRAREVAVKVGANADIAEASAWLHDIADATMARFADGHEAESMRIAHRLLTETGYSKADIAIIVDDALPLHGCHDGKRPATLEGKVLATADALAHLTTDYYIYTTSALSARLSLQDIKDWTTKKSARDFNDKICFDDVRESARSDYEAIKNLFSRPSSR